MQTLLPAVIRAGLVIAAIGGLAPPAVAVQATAAAGGQAAAPPGSQLWFSRFAGPGRTDNEASAVALSHDGRTVFVTGKSQGPLQGNGNGYDYATVAYDAVTGKQLWASRYDGHGSTDNDDVARAIAVSQDGGTVYVTGQSYTTPLNRRPEFLTASYNARTGAAGWARLFLAPGKCRNIPAAIVAGAGRRTVFVTGYSTDTNPAGRQPCAAGLTTIAYRGATGAQE